MIQTCPVEVLDKIFESTAYSDPENAQLTLCSLMLTCSHFRTIAKRHFIRVTCLSNAEKVNAFASFLKGAVESGDYGNGMLPIQHLAVTGKYSSHFPPLEYYQARSGTELESERVLPFIITTAAPSLLSLTIFGVDSHTEVEIENGYTVFHEQRVPDMVEFPQLRDLVALEQQLIPFDLDDNTAYISRFPKLCRVYVHGNLELGGFLSELPDLRHLRLEMFNTVHAYLPREQVPRIHSLIIDALQYQEVICYMHSMFQRFAYMAQVHVNALVSQHIVPLICVVNRRPNTRRESLHIECS
jgi:hypothetical protein